MSLVLIFSGAGLVSACAFLAYMLYSEVIKPVVSDIAKARKDIELAKADDANNESEKIQRRKWNPAHSVLSERDYLLAVSEMAKGGGFNRDEFEHRLVVMAQSSCSKADNAIAKAMRESHGS